ncbi:CoA transferase [Blastococcus sp. PRF04-17]|nr:CoA transferase [Blastococcus sp. PRF04-17]
MAALRERFTEVFAGRTRAEWWQVFEGTDACVAPVWSLVEATSDPHNRERGCSSRWTGRCSPAWRHGSRSRRARSARCPRWGSTPTRSWPRSGSRDVRSLRGGHRCRGDAQHGPGRRPLAAPLDGGGSHRRRRLHRSAPPPRVRGGVRAQRRVPRGG